MPIDYHESLFPASPKVYSFGLTPRSRSPCSLQARKFIVSV